MSLKQIITIFIFRSVLCLQKINKVIIIILYLTKFKIQLKYKTDYKSHNLQLGLFTPN